MRQRQWLELARKATLAINPIIYAEVFSEISYASSES